MTTLRDEQDVAKEWIIKRGNALYGEQNLWIQFREDAVMKEPFRKATVHDPQLSILFKKAYKQLTANKVYEPLRSGLQEFFETHFVAARHEKLPDAVTLPPHLRSSSSSPYRTRTPDGFFLINHAVNDLPYIKLALEEQTAPTQGRVVLNDNTLPSLALPDLLRSYAKTYAKNKGLSLLLFETDWNALVLTVEEKQSAAAIARLFLLGMLQGLVKDATNNLTTSPMIFACINQLATRIVT